MTLRGWLSTLLSNHSKQPQVLLYSPPKHLNTSYTLFTAPLSFSIPFDQLAKFISIMLMFSLLKTLQGGEPLVVELKNDCRVRGTLVSVDQSVSSYFSSNYLSPRHLSREILMSRFVDPTDSWTSSWTTSRSWRKTNTLIWFVSFPLFLPSQRSRLTKVSAMGQRQQ